MKSKIYEAYQNTLVNEAGKIDRAYAAKSIKAFNKKFASKDASEKEVKELATSIIKDLGYKPTKQNIDSLTDHLIATLSASGRLHTSTADFADIYKYLK